MTSTILWQILDTSAKIGIGAVVTAMFMFLIIARKNQAPKVSSGEQRRLDILETISADVGNVSHCFAKYSTLAVESIRFGKRWPPSRKTELEHVSEQLAIDFKKLSDAESKLLMLGEKTLQKTLRLYASKVAHFRREVYMGREDIKEEDILSMKRDINLLREQFYDFLSKKYDRLLAV